MAEFIGEFQHLRRRNVVHEPGGGRFDFRGGKEALVGFESKSAVKHAIGHPSGIGTPGRKHATTHGNDTMIERRNGVIGRIDAIPVGSGNGTTGNGMTAAGCRDPIQTVSRNDAISDRIIPSGNLDADSSPRKDANVGKRTSRTPNDNAAAPTGMIHRIADDEPIEIQIIAGQMKYALSPSREQAESSSIGRTLKNDRRIGRSRSGNIHPVVVNPSIDENRVPGRKRRNVAYGRKGGIGRYPCIAGIAGGRTVHVQLRAGIVDVPCRGSGTARGKSEAGGENGGEEGGRFHGHGPFTRATRAYRKNLRCTHLGTQDFIHLAPAAALRPKKGHRHGCPRPQNLAAPLPGNAQPGVHRPAERWNRNPARRPQRQRPCCGTRICQCSANFTRFCQTLAKCLPAAAGGRGRETD